jgi:hypothetical protein
VLLAAGALSAVSCGGENDDGSSEEPDFDRPVPHIGRGPGYELRPAGRRAAAARPVDGLHCTRTKKDHYGVHLEVFAKGLDVVIPAGIGIAPPRVRDGAYVRRGRCEYPARTYEPTGLIEIDDGVQLTLGQFFDLWGQPLGRRRLLGFRAPRGERVSAFVNGERQLGDPRSLPLRRHDAIVLEIDGYYPPTRKYLFPNGL